MPTSKERKSFLPPLHHLFFPHPNTHPPPLPSTPPPKKQNDHGHGTAMPQDDKVKGVITASQRSHDGRQKRMNIGMANSYVRSWES